MKHFFAASIALLALSGAASATPFANVPLPGGFLDVQYSAGGGPNAAYFVIDFAGSGSSPGGTYAFAFNWDANVSPNPTPADGLFAVEAVSNSPVLQMQTDDFGSTFHNYFVNTFSYGADSANPSGFPDTWTMFLGTYGSGQVTWGDPNDLTFGISAVDFSGNQIYSLEDGHFYGFDVGTFGEDFLIHAENPRLPVAAPEPAAGILIGLSGLLLIGAGIRNRRLLLRDAMESAQTPR